jgi:uncharacterized damage-inducible protein DinB
MIHPTRVFAVALFAAWPVISSAQALKIVPLPEGLTGFRAEFLHEANGEEAKFVSLAESIPADKYTWRPGPGVRSVSEVLLHVSGANYALPRLIGTPPPDDFKPQGYDKSTTDKAQIVEALHKSFAHLRAATLKLSDADADKPQKLFGENNTYRGVCFFMLKHMAEHLGQTIAYTRMIGITPAWTEEQQKASKR